MSKQDWVDPEILAAGASFGGASQPQSKKKELEKITLGHWRVKEWAGQLPLIAAGRNQFGELVMISDATEPNDSSPRYQCVRFFYLNSEVHASMDIQRGQAFEVFNYIMKLGNFEPLKRNAA